MCIIIRTLTTILMKHFIFHVIFVKRSPLINKNKNVIKSGERLMESEGRRLYSATERKGEINWKRAKIITVRED